MSLEGRNTVITGGANGIGFACARKFLDQGANVVIADVNDEAGRHALRALGSGARAHFVHADVCDARAIAILFDQVQRLLGGCDVLVSNAGIYMTRDFLHMTESDFDAVMRTNLKSMFLCGQAAARLMVRQPRGGAIVNMSSVTALVANPLAVAYGASKGAVNALTKGMAVALAPHRIRVNAVGPGTIDTSLAQRAVLSEADGKARVLARTPLSRLGDVEEVADAVVFLAGTSSSYITGQTLYVDGGRLGLNLTM